MPAPISSKATSTGAPRLSGAPMPSSSRPVMRRPCCSARARAAGVARVISVGSGLASCAATLELAEREDGVFAALGFHPHQAGEESDLGALRELLAHPIESSEAGA